MFPVGLLLLGAQDDACSGLAFLILREYTSVRCTMAPSAIEPPLWTLFQFLRCSALL
jgi:hypothetical protein